MGGGNKNSGTPASAVQSTPIVPAIPPVPPSAFPPTLGSSSGTLTGARSAAARMKAAGGMGFDNTIGTSPQGLTEKVTLAPVTLLGQ